MMDNNNTIEIIETEENVTVTEDAQIPAEVEEKPQEAQKITLPERFETHTGPYIRRSEKVQTIMLDTAIALLPALVWGAVAFGVRALLIAAISVVSAVGSELIIRMIMQKKSSVHNMSAVITGLLVAMCLPVNAPLWMPAVGSVFAIVIVKECFGGLGKNIFNPAAAAVVLLSFGERAIEYFTKTSGGAFNNTSAILPLEALKAGELPSESIFDLLIGNCAGAIGEVSSLFLIAGGVYLLFRRVITWHLPASFIGTVALVTLVFPQYTGALGEFMIYEILSGALILAAFFMATDPGTSPVTNSGKIIFGIGCGLITVIIRYFGASAEGVMYAILIMNLTVPLIEKLTKQKSLGK